MEPAPHKLATWVLSAAPTRLTHLKLQKLVFYCYGAALAYDQEADVGEVSFEAWEHGPVCPPLWREYRYTGAAPLPIPDTRPTYARPTDRVMQDALDVYAQMSAWALRNETHLELPWKLSWSGRAKRIDPKVMKDHFARKFRVSVAWPEHLGRPSSLTLDGLPSERFSSLSELAEAARNR